MTDKTPSLKIKEPPCPECGQPYIAKGSTVYAAIERILDEHSAWIARPSPEVTKAVAFAAVVAAHQIVDADRANHEAPLLAALKTIVEAGDCTVESIREGRAAIIAAEHGDPPCPASPRMTDSPTEQVERAFNRGGEEFLLAALEKIAAMPPRLMPSQLIDQ